MVNLLKRGLGLSLLLFGPLILIQLPYDLAVAAFANADGRMSSLLDTGAAWPIYVSCAVLLAMSIRSNTYSLRGGLKVGGRVLVAIVVYLCLTQLPVLAIERNAGVFGSLSFPEKLGLLFVAVAGWLTSLGPAFAAGHGYNPLAAMWQSALALVTQRGALLALLMSGITALAISFSAEALLPPLSRFPWTAARSMIIAFANSLGWLLALCVCVVIVLRSEIPARMPVQPVRPLRLLIVVSGIIVPAYLGTIIGFLTFVWEPALGPLSIVPVCLLPYIPLFLPGSISGAIFFLMTAGLIGWLSFVMTGVRWTSILAGALWAVLTLHIKQGSLTFQLPLLYLLSVILHVAASWAGSTAALWHRGRRADAS